MAVPDCGDFFTIAVSVLHQGSSVFTRDECFCIQTGSTRRLTSGSEGKNDGWRRGYTGRYGGRQRSFSGARREAAVSKYLRNAEEKHQNTVALTGSSRTKLWEKSEGNLLLDDKTYVICHFNRSDHNTWLCQVFFHGTGLSGLLPKHRRHLCHIYIDTV